MQNDRKYVVSPTMELLACDNLYFAPPEEYVRQDVIKTLHEDYGYPCELMVQECLPEDGRRIDVGLLMPSTERDPNRVMNSFRYPVTLSRTFLLNCKKN